MPQKSSLDPVADQYMEIFSWAYTQQRGDFERMVGLQQTYDNVINAAVWPTNSRIPIGSMFTQVQKALPSAMEYLFPTSNFIRLLPVELGMDMNTLTKVEQALYIQVVHKMKMRRYSYPTVVDCFKLGLGYGIVENYSIQLPKSFTLSTATASGIEKTRTMELGEPTKAIRFRYINPSCVVPYPDGADFNGTNAVSLSFLVDTYSEAQLEMMYSSQPVDVEDMPLKGNIKTIISDARQLGFDSRLNTIDLMAKLGDRDLKKTNTQDKRIPVRVPVVKVFANNRHIWIANGKQVIYDEEEKLQTMRCPLVKCSAWPDGNRWFPMSIPEALQKVDLAHNIWLNLLFDLMTWSAKRPLVYSTTSFDKKPVIGPDEVLPVSGDVRSGAMWLDPPQIDQSMMTVGQKLEQIQTDVAGQPNFYNKPGLVRGGGMAFTELAASSTARERLAGAILETTYLESAINQTLILMQTGAQPKETFQQRKSSQGKSDYIEQIVVTEEDLVNGFEVTLDLNFKNRKGVVESQNKIAVFDRLKDDPMVDPFEIRKMLIDDDESATRLLKSRDEMTRIQEENRSAALRSQEVGIQQKQAQINASTAPEAGAAPEEQGPVGAEAAIGAAAGGVE